MKIKAVAAIVALFFATSTFAQVAEPTTSSSTTIPAKGQAQTPANNGGTAKPNGKTKHAEGNHKRPEGQANPNGKAKHVEGEHKEGQSNGKAKHAEGDHKEGKGKANPNGKARHEEGENHEGHGDKGKMKKAEGTTDQPGTIEKKTMKAKKKAN